MPPISYKRKQEELHDPLMLKRDSILLVISHYIHVDRFLRFHGTNIYILIPL